MASKEIDLKVGVIAGETPSKDLINFLSVLGVTPSLNKDFYKTLENFLSSGDGTIDFDDMTNKFFSALAGSGKSAQLDPLGIGPPSTDNTDVGSYEKPDTTQKNSEAVDVMINQPETIAPSNEGNPSSSNTDVTIESATNISKTGTEIVNSIPEETKGSNPDIGITRTAAKTMSQALKELEDERKTLGAALMNDIYANKNPLVTIEAPTDTETSSSSELTETNDEAYDGKNSSSTHPKRVITEPSEKEIIEEEVELEKPRMEGRIRGKRVIVPSTDEDLTSKSDNPEINSTLLNMERNAPNKNNFEKNLDVLMYGLLPYGVASVVTKGTNILASKDSRSKFAQSYNPKDADSAQKVLNSSLGLFKLIQRRKYFSPTELAYFASGTVNMLTLLFKRGITIKDIQASKLGFGTDFNVSVAGARAINEAATSNANIVNKIRESIGTDNLNPVMDAAKETNTKKYNLGYLDDTTNAEGRKRSEEIEPGVNTNGLQKTDLDNWEEVVRLKQYGNAKWDIGKEAIPGETEKGHQKSDLEGYLNNGGEKTKAGATEPSSKEVPDHTEEPREYNFSFLDDLMSTSGIDEIDLGIGKAKLTTNSLNKFEHDKDADPFKWEHKESDDTIERNEPDTKLGDEKYDVVEYNRTKTLKASYKDMINGLKKRNDYKNVGAIYVWPIVDDEAGLGSEKIWIPFQFNPTISEGGISARYQSTQILSRIGNLFSYTGTDSLTVNLETRYFPVAKDLNDPPEGGWPSVEDGWLSAFDMRTVQLVEFGYRSLVLPTIAESDKAEGGYRYYKPPLLKIVMGDWINKVYMANELEKEPISNLLTYPRDMVNNNFMSDPQAAGGLKRYKTFIATSVNIVKDYANSPYYIDEVGAARDVMGYTVNMSLTEVSPSYTDSVPNFKDYYEFVISQL